MVIDSIFDFSSEGRKLEFATPLLSPAAPGMINNQATHGASSIAHESVAISEGRSISASDFDISLMY
jgi:hypothetical protein